MQHFAEQAGTDFVRGLSLPEISWNIKAHLATGCAKCKTAIDTWSRVQRLATDEATYTPPEDLVRMVKLGFTRQQANSTCGWALASLVFDSWTQPLLAGVRSGALNVWQVIYEAEGLTVDLRFGRRAHQTAVHLVGQVLDKHVGRAWRNATIELSTEQEQLIATTAVNASGEFQVEFEARDHLWLSVRTGDGNTVRIPLTNPK